MAFQKGIVNIFKHGYYKHPLYKVWTDMKMRCYNPNNIAYSNYGGRGITVCNEWKNDPKSFIEWAINNGWERGLQLDKDIIPKRRGEVSTMYSPETCCFATRKENNLAKRTNRIIEFNGRKQTLKEWSMEYGVSSSSILKRLKNHNSLERPKFKKTKGVLKGKPIFLNGKYQSMSMWAAEYGIKYKLVNERVNRRGMSLIDALTSPLKKNKYK